MVTDSLSLEPLSSETEELYNRLILSAPGACVSHTLAWRDLLQEIGMGTPQYWILRSHGEAIAALPAFVKHTTLGGVLNSLPLAQSTGGLLWHSRLNATAVSAAHTMLLQALLSWCSSHEIDVACLVDSAFVSTPLATVRAPDFEFSRTIQALDLQQPVRVRPSTQGAIEKAARLGSSMRIATTPAEVDLVHAMYAETLTRAGASPLPLAAFRTMFDLLDRPGYARFAWSEIAGVPAAGLLTTQFGGIVDYYACGATNSGREAQANSWLTWQQIQAAREEASWWNWMASPSDGVFRFKKRWGSTEKQYSIRLWLTGAAARLKRSNPAELADVFPGYFVLPYQWLE